MSPTADVQRGVLDDTILLLDQAIEALENANPMPWRAGEKAAKAAGLMRDAAVALAAAAIEIRRRT